MIKLSKVTKFTILGIFIALLPFVLDISKPVMTILNTAIVYCIIAIGFNILLGYGGQISLGHAAFMGLGAYITAYMTSVLKLPFLLSMLLAGLIPMLIGIILGLAALRLEGHYLAIATLGFGVTIQQVFKEWIGFTNGYSGLRVSYPEIFGFTVKTREQYFFMAVIILILLSLFAYNIIRSKTGRALIAMRDSEHAAQAMGISLFKYKLIAFSISAFYAGIAGCLYAHLIRFIEPTMWGIELSLNLLAMVVIGGLASIGGAIVGGTFITLIPEVIKNVPVLENFKNVSSVFTGICLVLVIMFLPHGLVTIDYSIKKIWREFRRVVQKKFDGGDIKNENIKS